jgi:competence protein ComEC
MILIVFIALLLNKPFHPSLLKNTTNLATVFQQKCGQILPQQSQNKAILDSMLCGQNLKNEELKENLTKTSLIHIFIISGTHLILFDKFLFFLKIPELLRFLFLSIYSLMIGWQPPAVRALIALVTRAVFRKFNFRFPVDLIVLIAGLLTLIFFPTWWKSLSLLMSWCAALALCWTSTLKIKNKLISVLISNLTIFIFMTVPLWGIGNLHPLSILYNIFLAPAVSFILLPLAFFTLAFHPLLKIFDFFIFAFNKIMVLISDPILTTQAKPPSIEFLWIWIFSLHIFFHIIRLYLYRGKDTKK